MLAYRDLTNRIIGLAIEMHRTTDPDLLESVHTGSLGDELAQAGIPFQRQVGVPVTYEGRILRPLASTPTSWWRAPLLSKSRLLPRCCRRTMPGF